MINAYNQVFDKLSYASFGFTGYRWLTLRSV